MRISFQARFEITYRRNTQIAGDSVYFTQARMHFAAAVKKLNQSFSNPASIQQPFKPQ
jgi:hypothetical protein